MKIGATFPQTEIGNDPIVIRDYVQAVEELGYDHLLVFDHVLGAHPDRFEGSFRPPYTNATPFHEPFVLFGYLAGLTTKLEFATGIVILPQRQTALVAKQAAEVALLSGGRLTLGVGTGWNWVEYESLNEDFGTRGKRFDEQVELLRTLWSAPVVDFEGRYHRVDRAGILPQPPRIPIWFGGFSPVAIRRAARIGDGFLFGAATTPMRKLAASLREELAKHGREQGFEIDAVIHYSAGQGAWRTAAEQWKALGATHFSMRAMDTGATLTGEKPAGFKSVADHIRGLREFAEALRD